MRTLGIDPGKNGAFACLDNGKLIGVRALPMVQDTLKACQLYRWIQALNVDVVAIEAFQDHAAAPRPSMIAHALLVGELFGIVRPHWEVMAFSKPQWRQFAGFQPHEGDKELRAWAEKFWPEKFVTEAAERKAVFPASWVTSCLIAHAAELSLKGSRVM